MNRRKTFVLLALLMLSVCSTTAFADEKSGSVSVGLGSSSLSGYVDDSGMWTAQPASRQHALRMWLYGFFHRLHLLN